MRQTMKLLMLLLYLTTTHITTTITFLFAINLCTIIDDCSRRRKIYVTSFQRSRIAATLPTHADRSLI